MKILYFIVFFIFFAATRSPCQEIDTAEIRINKIPADGILLNDGWKFHAGDDRKWAEANFDDRAWQPVDPATDIHDIPALWKTPVNWFRLRFTFDSSLTEQAIAVMVEQTGASEIFLNGNLIEKFGTIGNDNSIHVRAVMPVRGSFIALPVIKGGEQVLAVRFAVQKNLPYLIFAGRQNMAFALRAIEVRSISRYFRSNIHLFFDFMRGGLFLILSILHLALFCFNPSQKANLYFFIYAFLFATTSFLASLVYTHVEMAATKLFFLITLIITWILSSLFFLSAVYKIFVKPRGLIFRLLVAGAFLSVLMYFINYKKGPIINETFFFILIFLETLRITISAAKERKRGARIVIAGAAGYLLFYSLTDMFVLGLVQAGPNAIYLHLAYNLGSLMLPIAISIYLALESSFVSHLLKEKLQEVKQLLEKTITQEKEKQELLAVQNETLEQRVTQRTAQLKQSLEDLKVTQAQLIQSEKMASLGELTAGIAHEIQNPLNFVNNFSDVNTELIEDAEQELDKGNIDEVKSVLTDVKENEQKINHHGKRADAIVKGMLQHSRSSSGKKEPTDINALADEYLRLSYYGLRAKDKEFNANFKTDFDENIGKIEVAPQDIGRVLLNLYNNAFYSVSQKKTQLNGAFEPAVSVSTKRIGDKVEISVKDNGTGIPQKVLDKIYQPFFTTKPAGQGTGLGLSLSFDIIRAHGGELKVETKEGEGAEFVMKLPL